MMMIPAAVVCNLGTGGIRLEQRKCYFGIPLEHQRTVEREFALTVDGAG